MKPYPSCIEIPIMKIGEFRDRLRFVIKNALPLKTILILKYGTSALVAGVTIMMS